jgi:hypothetical protein
MTQEEIVARSMLLKMSYSPVFLAFKSATGWLDAETLEPLDQEQRRKRVAMYLKKAQEMTK